MKLPSRNLNGPRESAGASDRLSEIWQADSLAMLLAF